MCSIFALLGSRQNYKKIDFVWYLHFEKYSLQNFVVEAVKDSDLLFFQLTFTELKKNIYTWCLSSEPQHHQKFIPEDVQQDSSSILGEKEQIIIIKFIWYLRLESSHHEAITYNVFWRMFLCLPLLGTETMMPNNY